MLTDFDGDEANISFFQKGPTQKLSFSIFDLLLDSLTILSQIPFASINSNNQRTNPLNFHQKILCLPFGKEKKISHEHQSKFLD